MKTVKYLTFNPWNFHLLEHLFPRAKVTWNFRSLTLIIIRPPGILVPVVLCFTTDVLFCERSPSSLGQ